MCEQFTNTKLVFEGSPNTTHFPYSGLVSPQFILYSVYLTGTKREHFKEKVLVPQAKRNTHTYII